MADANNNPMVNPDASETFDDKMEKESYSPASYRVVRKVRVRAAEYGIDVPYLKDPLTPRTAGKTKLKIMAILSGVLIAAAVGLLIWWIVVGFGPVFGAVLQGGEIVEASKNIPVLDLFGALGGALLITLAVGLVLLAALPAILMVGYLVLILRLISMNLSMEEMAVGYYVGRVKTNTLIFAILLILIGGASLGFAVPFGVLLLLNAAFMIACLVMLQKERNAAKIEFKQLPQEQQDAFLAHTKGLKTATSRWGIRHYRKRLDYSGAGKFAWVLRLLDGFIDARIVYSNMKNSPFRQQSTGLLRRAWRDLLIFAVSVALVVGAIILTGSFWRVAFMIAGGVWLVYETLIVVPQVLNYTIKQLCLNKHPLAWVTLVVAILLVAGEIGLIALATTL